MASVKAILASANVQLTLAPIDLFEEFLAEGWTTREIREYLKLSEHETQGFLKQLRDRG